MTDQIGIYVVCVYIDHKNRIWFGSEKGLAQFVHDAPDGKVFIQTRVPKIWTTQIAPDQQGRLWLKTVEGFCF